MPRPRGTPRPRRPADISVGGVLAGERPLDRDARGRRVCEPFPDLARGARTVTGPVQAAHAGGGEPEPRGQHGGQSAPTGGVPPARHGELRARVHERTAAARTDVPANAVALLLPRSATRHADEVGAHDPGHGRDRRRQLPLLPTICAEHAPSCAAPEHRTHVFLTSRPLDAEVTRWLGCGGPGGDREAGWTATRRTRRRRTRCSC